jgi:hypothetical protein
MRTMQLLTIMCSSSQNAVSTLALDTVCQLVSLPSISLHPALFDTRSTRSHISQLQSTLKSVLGPNAIRSLKDAVLDADSRAAACSAVLSLRIIHRDTWGSQWCLQCSKLCTFIDFLTRFSEGTLRPACSAATRLASACPLCHSPSPTVGRKSCPLECRITKRALPSCHLVGGVQRRY